MKLFVCARWCCSETPGSQDGKIAPFVVDATLEAGTDEGTSSDCGGRDLTHAAQMPVLDENTPVPDERAAPQAKPTNETDWSVAKLEPQCKDKAAEKQRIVGILKQFVLRACDGVDAYIADERGNVAQARYLLSQDLAHLVISAEGKDDMSCEIKQVQRFCRGSNLVPAAVKSLSEGLGADMMQRLVLLDFGQKMLVRLIESTAEDADNLVTAVWVLRSYNQRDGGVAKLPSPKGSEKGGHSAV